MRAAGLKILDAVPDAAPEPDSMPDARLVERFREGDRDAFTALYRAHHGSVHRFALRMTGDPASAAEVTQDVFVWLIHHADEFDAARGSLPAFLVGVARQFLRRRRRDEQRWLPFDSATSRAEEAVDPGRAIDAGSLRRAIARLPERYREVVVLCDLEGKSYEEAAALLGCPVGTVRSRRHRACELLIRKFRSPS